MRFVTNGARITFEHLRELKRIGLVFRRGD